MMDREVPRYLTNIISDYFSEREIKSGKLSRQMSAGVPQGSVLGPTLWNILYDDILRLTLPPETHIIGYADDIALIIKAKDIRTLNRRIRDAAVTDWLQDHHLKLAPEKTEALVLKGPYKRTEIEVWVAGRRVELSRTVDYLGVTFDSQGYFGPHVLQVITKAERRLAALSRLMPNLGGPSSMKRETLWGVVKSTILYAAPVWHCALKVERYRKMIESIQRKVLLRVASAYRTVSAQALQVIAGVTPLDLLIEERASTWPGEENPWDKKEAEEESRRKWQERWTENESVGQWSKRLIPNIKLWTDCKHRRIGYWVTQFLSGHGSFRAFTYRINKDLTDACRYCGQCDTPEHTIFRCGRWSETRRSTWGQGHAEVTPIVAQMVSSPEEWNIITRGIIQIMSKKEEEERAFQSGNPPPDYLHP